MQCRIFVFLLEVFTGNRGDILMDEEGKWFLPVPRINRVQLLWLADF